MSKIDRFKESLRSMDDIRLELKAKHIIMILAKTGASPKKDHPGDQGKVRTKKELGKKRPEA